MKEKSYLSVVMCLNYNNVKARNFIQRIHGYLNKRFEHFELILINNGIKNDNYVDIQSLKAKNGGHVSLVNLAWKQSIETAMLAGTDAAVGDFVIEIDAPENIGSLSIIQNLFDKCTKGFDVVSATPINSKTLISQLFYLIVKKFANISVNLQSEPIRIVSRRALNSALRSKERNRFRQISYQMTGFPHAVISYRLNRSYAPNKSFAEKISLASEVILNYTDLGLKLTVALSFIFLLLSFAAGIYTVYIYLNFNQVVSGWTTTMLFLSFGFSGFFLITGILTKYLTMILSEIKNQRPYTVGSIKKIK